MKLFRLDISDKGSIQMVSAWFKDDNEKVSALYYSIEGDGKMKFIGSTYKKEQEDMVVEQMLTVAEPDTWKKIIPEDVEF